MAWLNEAEKLNFEQDYILPYEYVCWREILFDVADAICQDNDFISKALEILPTKNCELEKIFETDILSKLFFTKNDNKTFDELIKIIDKNIGSEGIDLSKTEETLKENINNIFDEKTKNLFIKRLQKIAFILMSNSKNNIASQIYNLTKNEELLNEFFLEVLKKSIFVFYQQEFQNKMNVSDDNIFMKKSQKDNTSLEPIKIKELLETILNEWGKDV